MLTRTLGGGPVTAARHRAVDVPRLRDRLLECWESGMLLELLTAHPSTQMQLPVHHRNEVRGQNVHISVQEWTAFLLDRLRRAELFYVTRDMTELVIQASQGSPTYQLWQDQLPAEIGFVVFAQPYCAVPPEKLGPDQRVEINAALWAPVPDVGGGPEGPQPGLMLVTLQDTEVLMWTQPTGDLSGSPVEIRAMLERMCSINGPLSYHEEYPLPYGDRPWNEDPGMVLQNQAVSGILTTLTLMAQRITTVEQEPLPRAVRRQATREGRPEPRVRTVSLRQATRGRAVDPQEVREGEPRRSYTKRWPVKGYGYWRNTWYPSQQRHQQQYVWVPDYIKGPEGAPLVGGERVNVLRR